MNIYAARPRLTALLTLLLLLAGCGGTGPQPVTPTAASTQTRLPDTPTSTPTSVPTATATLTPTKTPVPTATPNVAATQQYESLLTTVEQLAEEGTIPSAQGKYYPLADYSRAFAQIQYYAWETYDDAEPANFVLQARVRLENATTEGAYKSGCGFIMQNAFNHHAVFFALDGNANYWSDGYSRGSNYLDNALYAQNPDGVLLTMVLSNKALFFYVNGRKALSGITIYGEPFRVGPAVLSGTSEGFGTRCDFTEMGLWEIE